jgi:hypothetical protein
MYSKSLASAISPRRLSRCDEVINRARGEPALFENDLQGRNGRGAPVGESAAATLLIALSCRLGTCLGRRVLLTRLAKPGLPNSYACTIFLWRRFCQAPQIFAGQNVRSVLEVISCGAIACALEFDSKALLDPGVGGNCSQAAPKKIH